MKKPCELCGGVHDSIDCADRDMTIIGLCNLCLGVARESYRHKVNEKMQHLACVARGFKPYPDEVYAKKWEEILLNKAEWDKPIPIPEWVLHPDSTKKFN